MAVQMVCGGMRKGAGGRGGGWRGPGNGVLQGSWRKTARMHIIAFLVQQQEIAESECRLCSSIWAEPGAIVNESLHHCGKWD